MSSGARRWLWLILATLCALGMWNYVAHIWSAGQPAHFSDLYSSWWAAHEVFLHRRNPYTPAVAHEIQAVIYGAPLAGSLPGSPDDIAGGFAYPLYVTFLMWPTVRLAFPLVQDLFAILFFATTLMSVWLWRSALGWPLRRFEMTVISVFILGSFPVLQGMALQNLSLLAGFLIAAAMASLAAERLKLAGVLLALATAKPQFVILLIPSLAFWTVADWRGRRPLAWSFLGSVTVLVLASEALLPGWIRNFLALVSAYKHYTYGHSLLDVWLTPRFGIFAGAGVVLLVLSLCWRARAAAPTSVHFVLTSSLALAATLIVIPTLEPHAQILLLPSILWLLCFRRQVWHSGKLVRLLLVAVWLVLGWAWMGAWSLTLAAIWVSPLKRAQLWLLPLYTTPLAPFAVLLVLGLMLVKWQPREPDFSERKALFQ